MRKIAIDPGHGGSDPGCVGFGVKEKDLALKYSLSLKWLLEKKGYSVVLTRDKDVFVGLSERPLIAKRVRADVFISIHFNAGDSRASGLEVWYHDNDVNGKRLAEVAESELKKVVNSRGVKKDTDRYRSGFAVLRGCSRNGIPAILVEVGFLTNFTENSMLVTDAVRIKLMSVLADSIDRYLKGG